MANGSGSSSRAPWIIGGSIVLAGLLIVIVLVLLLGGNNGNDQAASPSGSVTQPSPSPSKSPHVRKSPDTPLRLSPSPTPSLSPTIDPTVAIREAVGKQANRDRPGEVKHVGQVDFYTDKAGCPQSGQASSTMVRFSTQPKAGIYIFCKAKVHWKYSDGPIYGE